MYCPKCGTSNENSSCYCFSCGTALGSNAVESSVSSPVSSTSQTDTFYSGVSPEVSSAPPIKKSRKKTVLIFVFTGMFLIIIALAAALFFFLSRDPVSDYLSLLTEKDYDRAAVLYDKEIEPYADKMEDLKQSVQERLKNLEQQFIDEKLSYEEVIKQIDVYQYVKDLPTYFSDTNGRIRALYGSRIAYKNGMSYESNKQYVNAIQELQKVIAADSHYDEAQKKIESLMPFYKKEMLANAKKLADAKKYEEAIESLNEALIMLPKDPDLAAKRKEYQSLQKKADEAAEKKRLEDAKKNQKLTVTSCRAYDVGYSIILRRGEVVVKNKTNKVVKDYTVGMLLFDDNGYPVDVEYSFQGEGNLMRGKSSSANVLAGQSNGENSYWDIPDRATRIKACVISATFMDGTTWSNDYFDSWFLAEKDRY